MLPARTGRPTGDVLVGSGRPARAVFGVAPLEYTLEGDSPIRQRPRDLHPQPLSGSRRFIPTGGVPGGPERRREPAAVENR